MEILLGVQALKHVKGPILYSFQRGKTRLVLGQEPSLPLPQSAIDGLGKSCEISQSVGVGRARSGVERTVYRHETPNSRTDATV